MLSARRSGSANPELLFATFKFIILAERGMRSIIAGVKAGALSGLIYGIFAALATYAVLTLFKAEIIAEIEKVLPPIGPLTPEEVYALATIMTPGFIFIAGVVGGLILGAIYGWSYEKIPGKAPLVKGLVFGFIAWIALYVLLGVGTLGYGTLFYASYVVSGLFVSIVFGVLLGAFYARLTAKAPAGP